MYLLDTNACIDFLDARNQHVADRIDAAFGHLTVSAITVAELRVGSKTSTDPVGDARRIDAFVAGVKVTAFDEASATTYGNVIRKIGVKRKSFDRLIGIQALTLGLTLVTSNEKDFADVPGLKIENWTVAA
ncbi:type II toxin-antitoxin system VapC family toxin [Parasphingorhabdus sp.]|uniref:type II toxin-antitoxin system VapC family toxin n=1 Tax=Parasphingorhabdus sp. TaxID=2709688 RepID=UPI003A9003CB